ncbi:MAG: 2Fe-2S iron-sulfur cluster binding domain-containing protein [candidate division Zixibacteria bacterium]|nr:2Fe-2S iron-sulfur cluster binding domain-containing protein [candidate division Zixibacteria bacterium]
MKLDFVLNNKRVSINVKGGLRLIDLLREQLDLVGTKEGCGKGECGACTVLLDGKPVCSCLILASQVRNREVTTIEGLSIEGEMHPAQEAFTETGAVQCGFCSPGLLLSTVALLNENPEPSREQIRRALSGNLCRCTGYEKIFEAVELASRRINGLSVQNDKV